MKTLTLILILHVFLIYSEGGSQKKKDDSVNNEVDIEDNTQIGKSKGPENDVDDDSKDSGKQGKKKSKDDVKGKEANNKKSGEKTTKKPKDKKDKQKSKQTTKKPNKESATEVATEPSKGDVLPPNKPQNDTSNANNNETESQTKQPKEVLTPDGNCLNQPEAEDHTEVLSIPRPPGVQDTNPLDGGVHKLTCYRCADKCQMETEEKCTEHHDSCYYLEYEGGYVEKGCIVEQNWNYTFERRHEVHGGPTSNSYRCEGSLCNSNRNY